MACSVLAAFASSSTTEPLLALLVVAGVALVRRSLRAPTLATVAAVAWLALVVITRAVHPWMSIFTLLLAVVFPVALLVFVWMGRGRDGMGRGAVS